MSLNLNIEGFTFPELYSNLEELGYDESIVVPESGDAGIFRISDDLFRFMLPDGKYVYFNSVGEILKIN